MKQRAAVRSCHEWKLATPSSASQHSRHPRDLGLPAPRTSSPRFGTCTAFFSSNYTLTTLSPPTLT
ncbi:BQ5605_C011g06255 [Microbotryum silenes-dioicae]|uniref:BQ5605_C011g06255 protein n=1 Tax=Microbotryum silenes-dioicae TaxID=796604 RepID=A0A2X0M980_9BASI|nr:BQ5605_C011g06255 [Microbotryum silenes-dioicae]